MDIDLWPGIGFPHIYMYLIEPISGWLDLYNNFFSILDVFFICFRRIQAER